MCIRDSNKLTRLLKISNNDIMPSKYKEEFKTANSIKQKLELNEAVITKSDKGSTLAVSYTHLIHKANTFAC